MSESRDWIDCTIGEISKLQGGSAFKEEFQGNTTGEIPFIKVSDFNLSENEKYITRANNWVTTEMLKEMGARVFPEGSVVFPKVGAALLSNRRRILSRPTALDNNLMAAIPNGCRSDYLHLALCQIDFSRFVQEGAVPSVNQEQVASVELSLPPLPEQKKIAEILSGIDSTISAAESKLQKLITARSKVSEDLLSTSNTEVDRLPLCECIELVRGYAFKSEEYREKGGMRILRVTNIRDDGRIDLTNNCVRISEDQDDQYARFQVKEDDLLLVMVGATTGKLGVVSKAEIPSLLNQNIWCLRTSSPRTMIQKYLHYSIPKVVSKHLEKQQGSARDFLTQKEFFKEEIEIPNLVVQEKVVQAVGQIDKCINAIKDFKGRILFLKSAMSSDLLSGRKRVSV
jgi:restriction endonuclease S subunit